MRKIDEKFVIDLISKTCIDINTNLSEDIIFLLKKAQKKERCSTAKKILELMSKNIQIAKKEALPICQDTGMVVVFVEIGNNIKLKDNTLEEIINRGVEKGYNNLRNSVVKNVFDSISNNNSPAVIHSRIVRGENLKLSILAKGAGAENKSKLKMFNPTVKKEEIEDFIVKTVVEAGGQACPPLVVGVGLGGNFEQAPLNAKKALTFQLPYKNPDFSLEQMQKSVLKKLNKTGLGPQGMGGDTTAIAVNIISAPRHIASFPVAVNLCCYLSRHKTIII